MKRTMMASVAVFGLCGTAKAEPIVILFSPFPFGTLDYITTTMKVASSNPALPVLAW